MENMKRAHLARRGLRSLTGWISPAQHWVWTWGLKVSAWAYMCNIYILVWTLCLMHRCVCIWRYILQNYMARHAFPRQWHMRRGVIYFCQGFLPCMMPSMDGWRDRRMDERVTWCHRWMDDRTDGWMGHVKKLHEKWPQCPEVFGLSHMFWAPIQMWRGKNRCSIWDRGTRDAASVLWRRRRLLQQEDGGVTEYLQLDWTDDGTDGRMEKASRPRLPLLYVIYHWALTRGVVPWPFWVRPLNDHIRASPTVLSMGLQTVKFTGKQSKCAGRFSSGNWFSCTTFVQLAVAGETCNSETPKKSVINWTCVRLSISDWSIRTIGPGGLLLVVLPYIPFQVQLDWWYCRERNSEA